MLINTTISNCHFIDKDKISQRPWTEVDTDTQAPKLGFRVRLGL